MNMGVPPSGSGHSAEPEPEVSALRASVPNAVTISGELYAFLMGEGPLEGVWFGEMNEGYSGAFWWRALLRCAAGWPAQAGEAGTAEARSGSVHEHAVSEADAPKPRFAKQDSPNA